MTGTVRGTGELARLLSEVFGLEGRGLDGAVGLFVSRGLGRGDRLFAQGEPGGSLFVIGSGCLKLARRTPAGRDGLVALLGPGEVLGEMALLDGSPRGTGAVAVTDSVVHELGQADFDRWLASEPAMAVVLLRHLAQRLRRTDDVIGDLVFADVASRVARVMLDLAERFGTVDSGGRVVVRHQLTQEELAQLVGAARETVNKVLASFAAHGWVELQRRGFVLLDRTRLAAHLP